MTVLDIAASQLVDPFRIALIAMLLVTTARTSTVTGSVLPLALGLLFVAVVIPATFSREGNDFVTRISIGLVTNAVIMAVLLAARSVYLRMARPGR